jgi:hypothetical protein
VTRRAHLVGLILLLAAPLITACDPAPPRSPSAGPGPSVSAASAGPGPASPPLPATSSPAPPADPDTDADGIPDRCDACPLAGGQLWDGYPILDGCSTGPFHALVREPEGTILRISFRPGSSEPPPAADIAAAIQVFKADGVQAIGVVGLATASEAKADELARERARRLIALLKAEGVKADITVYTMHPLTPRRSAVDLAVLVRDSQPELRWTDGRFEHVQAAAARERKAQAQGVPSPCGRVSGAPLPPP